MTIFAYFAFSARTNASNCSGVVGAGSAPCAFNLSLASSDPSHRTISALSLRTISGGVPAGTKIPYHVEMSNPGTPTSAIVGKSGASDERFAVVTANAFSLPAFICAIELARLSNMNCTCPPSRSCIAGAPPLYGTWTMSTFASDLKSSPARCPALPLLPDANESLPGLAFARAINSATEFAGTDGLSTSTFGVTATSVTGAKSFSASYGILA